MTEPGKHASHAAPRRSRTGPVVLVLLLVAALVGGGMAVALTRGDGAPARTAATGPTPEPSTVAATPTAASPPPSASASPTPATVPASLTGVTTWLLYTTGSRAMTAYDAHKYGITGFAARGEDGLTDSIILAVLDGKRRDLSLLSIPRDTWLDWRGARINATYDAAGGGTRGATAFSADVARLTGIPVDHTIEVNFTAAAQLADVVGGVDIAIPHPMRDTKSHLSLPTAGCVLMDGRTTLAFSRSRHTQVYEGGRWRTDTSASDFGRASRQQAVVSAALRKLLSAKLPVYLPALAETVHRTLRFDGGLDYAALVQAAAAFAAGPGLTVHHYGLTSYDATVGGQAVLRTDYRAAAPIVARLAAAVPGARLPAAYGTGWRASTDAPLPLDGTAPVVLQGFATGPNGSYASCTGGTAPPRE